MGWYRNTALAFGDLAVAKSGAVAGGRVGSGQCGLAGNVRLAGAGFFGVG
jgi:hypothetical protein